jgi:hypothetical protein
MAYFQKNTPPPNQILDYPLANFVGGLNNRSNQLEINQASDVLNMAFADDTLMEKRKGTDFYDAVLVGGVSITFIGEYEPYSDTKKVVRATDANLYVDGALVSAVSGKVRGMTYTGQYYFVDGSAVRIYGKFPQTADTHTKIVGTADPNYLTLKLVNPPAGFTPLGTTETKGVWAYDYTAKTCWYEPCQNEIDDTYKGSNVLPQNPKFIEVHGDRLFLSGSNLDDDNVFITDVGNGFYCPVYLPIGLPPNSDKIVGLKVFHDAVVVGRTKDIHVIYGNTNRTSLNAQLFRLVRINSHTGFASQEAVDLAHNHMFFLGNDGNLYALNTPRSNVEFLSTQILNLTLDIFKSPVSLALSDLSSSSSAFYHDEWYVAIGNKVLVYSYRHRAWTMYKFTNFNVTSLALMGNELVLGGSNGRLIKFIDDYYDLGHPYKGFWASKVNDQGHPSIFKQYREFYIVAHTYSAYRSDVQLRFEVDHNDIQELHTIANQLAIWGKSLFGSRFINRNIVASLPVVIGRRGRGIKIIFSNGYEPGTPVATKADLDTYTGVVEGQTLVLVQDENTYYLYKDKAWVAQTAEDLKQPMKVYEVNGQYELRGKR